VLDPARLRAPQIAGYDAVHDHFAQQEADREVALVLPVGCGKSTLIAILPFAVHARRALVIAPNLHIARQLRGEVDPTDPDRNALHKRGVVPPATFWESAVLSGAANASDLAAADVVVANIQQLAGEGNRWLEPLAPDFFDLLVIDEAHHNVAASWQRLREKFPGARIVGLSATPMRADGQQMIGKVIYSYPIREAMDNGYIRQLRAVRINPRNLRYVERQGEREVEISIEEIRALGETDAKFRRTIVMSPASLASIVDASIQRLNGIRQRTGDNRHKIIASALNQTHCAQVVEAYRARNLRVDFVHANLGDEVNEEILARLERHELDVIVQIRKLGEGFDHPYLTVAAICNVYGSLTPFLQFVGRVMRKTSDQDHEEGVVVFHAGSNVAQLWDDLRAYSDADQEYFEQLLPLDEDMPFGDDENEREIVPGRAPTGNVTGQQDVHLEDIPLLEADPEVQRAMDVLAAADVDPEVLRRIGQAPPEELRELFTTRQNRRIAARARLTETTRTLVGGALARRGLNPGGMSPRPPDDNFRLAIRTANEALARRVERPVRTRDEWSLEEYELLIGEAEAIVEGAVAEAFDGR
jgi:superfamily II DNA or RNA helicase